MAVPAEPILASTLWNSHLAAPATETSRVPKQDNKVATGCRAIDTALEGGREYGNIHCISAETSNEAREIYTALLVSHLLSAPNATASIIDTTLSFDVRKLYHALAAEMDVRSDTNEDAVKVLERLRIMKAFDFEGLVESVTEIRHALERADVSCQASSCDRGRPPRGPVGDSDDEADDMLDNIAPHTEFCTSSSAQHHRSTDHGLLIIDSISQCVLPLLKSNYVQSQALLTSFMRSLAHLTKSSKLCTLLTNGVCNGKQSKIESPSIFSSCQLQPALGKTFSYLLDTHMLIHQVPRNTAPLRTLQESGSTGLAGSVEMASVIEILQDRYGGRVGRWAAFTSKDGRLQDIG